MSADDLRAIPEACDAAGNCVGWVPVPVAARDAIVALIDAARALHDDIELEDIGPCYASVVQNPPLRGDLGEALAALDGTP